MAPPHLLSCVWRDTTKDGVWFLSTCHDGRAAPGEVRRRKRGQPAVTKAAPQVAIDYNRYMGGCDRANSLPASYNTYLTHKKRWYVSLFYFCIDLLLVNAAIYRNQRSPADESMAHKAFRVQVVKLFACRAFVAGRAAAGTSEHGRKRFRVDKLPPELKQPGAHLIDKIEGDQRMCFWCYRTKNSINKTAFLCATCRIPLHSHCFKPCHEASDASH